MQTVQNEEEIHFLWEFVRVLLRYTRRKPSRCIHAIGTVEFGPSLTAGLADVDVGGVDHDSVGLVDDLEVDFLEASNNSSGRNEASDFLYSV
jgi:hypothetical protein